MPTRAKNRDRGWKSGKDFKQDKLFDQIKKKDEKDKNIFCVGTECLVFKWPSKHKSGAATNEGRCAYFRAISHGERLVKLNKVFVGSSQCPDKEGVYLKSSKER